VKSLNIIIPAYQPDSRLLALISEIKANSDYHIILVDDGSSSDCEPIFQEAVASGCTVLTHPMNQGKGAALKTAFNYVLNQNETDGFVCADCDGQHTWKDIQTIGAAISTHPSSIILGSREFIGTVPLKSMLGNKLTRVIFTLLTGNKITDTQTGLRGFSSAMLPWLVRLKGSRYEYEMNQLLEAKHAGYDLYSIPIQTIYEDNNIGSHFHPIRDSILVYLPILKFSMSSITCGILDFGLLFIIKSLSGNLLVSVIIARVISSLCNYLLNKHMVFQSDSEKKLVPLFQYYLLAVFVLTCNYLLLSFLTEVVVLSLFLSKLLTEGMLFVISYLIQHRFIFKSNKVTGKI
jgi:putative flippase GtrA